MSEPDNFLSRWSRRKAEAAEKDAELPATPNAEAKSDVPAKNIESGIAAPAAQRLATPPAFDPATLPSIESIAAGTDISAFLKAGVPAELTRAALRRAWAADPNIRDFIGLSENSWDFTAPGGVPGFGPLSAEEAGRLMAQFTSTAKEVVGKTKDAIERIGQFDQPAESAQTDNLPIESSKHAIDREDATQPPEKPAQEQPKQNTGATDGQKISLQREEENTAMQHETAKSGNAHSTRRAHGSALPD